VSEEFVSVRYIVNEVGEAIDFYTRHLGFAVQQNAAPAFASVTRGKLRLLLSGPASSGARPMPDGRSPWPAAGHVFLSSFPIFQPRSIDCAPPGSAFVVRL
jgi:hypothetical protein